MRMKLVIGQGNPGTQYDNTRHNVGFMALDMIAAREGASWKTETKHRALIATIYHGGEKILLVKPQTFYNDTGMTVRSLVDFYKLSPETNLLAIHYELALPLGTVRVRNTGSDAGNNGIKSILSHVGPTFWRIKVGIWSELRDRMSDADYVLGRFSREEMTTITERINADLFPLIDSFIAGSIKNTSITIATV